MQRNMSSKLLNTPDKLRAKDRDFINRLVTATVAQMGKGRISLHDIASEMCITRGQLNRRVKSLTGMTAQQYTLSVRMRQARILLQEQPLMPINEIAYHCGFDDATSFSRAFRRSFSTTPSSYREQEGLQTH